MRFRDRREAGQLLAEELDFLKGQEDVIVLGIPRGGVVVAYEVAQAMGVPLDVYITRKIGAPHNPELAIGAVASDGGMVLDHDLVRQLGVPESYIERETERQRQEIERRAREYRGDRPPLDLAGKIVVVVDDGVATGATTIATLRALQKQEPKELILAIPVGPPDTVKQLGKEADRVICLSTPRLFWAVGAFYAVFDQTSDEEVKRLLGAAPSPSGGVGGESNPNQKPG